MRRRMNRPCTTRDAGISIGFAACILCLGLFWTSCGRSPAQAEPRRGFVVPRTGPLMLELDDDGSLVPVSQLEDKRAKTGQPRPHAPFAMARAVAAIQPLADEGILAINRIGLLRVRVERHEQPAESRLVALPISQTDGEFSGRTVGSSWAHDGEAFFLLYHHPIFEATQPRTPPSIVLAASEDGARVADSFPGSTAYAVFPVLADAWLAQYRSDDGQRVTTSYALVAASSGSSTPLSQLAFEKQASPLPVASAPPSLRLAAAGLAGPLLIEARFPDGTRRTYVRGDPAEASPTWGQVAEPGSGSVAAMLVTDDWRVSIVPMSTGEPRTARTTLYEAPVPEARVRDAALVGGLIVAVWEEDLFPDIGASGIMVVDPGL